MALVVHRNLKKTSILSGIEIPSISIGVEDQQYVRLTTQTLFIKMKAVFDTVVFDKNTKPYNIFLSETYLSCNGPVSQSTASGIGVKTIPIITNDMFVVAFKIRSIGSNYPFIGFCDKNKSPLDTSYINTVLLDLKQNRINYTAKSGQTYIDFYNKAVIKNDDIVHFAVCKENKLWVGVNGTWYISDPDNTDILNPCLFTNDNLIIQEPTIYIVPNGCIVDIVDFPYTIPTMYTQARSTPILDWYKSGLFKREGYL